MRKYEPIRLIKYDEENIAQEMSQDDVYDLLPDAKEFKKTSYYNYSKDETKDYISNLENARTFYDRDKERMDTDKKYHDYMKNKYTQFSRKGNKIYKKVYNEIILSNNVCAYCNLRNRDVAELDHFFPKASFPSLAITVKNLIPSCTYCNHPKKEKFPLDYVLLHPYYDNCLLDVYEYLKYTIKEFRGHKIIGDFYIIKSGNMDDKTYNRIKKHFEFFNLNKYYKKDFLSEYDEFIECLYSVDNLKEKLERKRDYNKNKRAAPWLYAGFDALIHSKDFYLVAKRKTNN